MRTGSPTACPRTRRDGHRRREKRAGQTLVLPPPANFPNRTAFQTTEPWGKSFSTMIRETSKAAVQRQKVAVAAPGRKSEFGQPQLDMSATEWRKMVAHGVSRGEPCALAKSPVRGDRVGSRRTFFRRFA